MNVLMLLKNKEQVAYLYDTNTVRQGLEKMKRHKYTAIPVLTESGYYAGCISDGDFLWHMMEFENNHIKRFEEYMIRTLIRDNFNPPAKINITMDELLQRSMNQNFIPIIDDRNYFIGIVTRQDIIANFLNKK